MDLGKRSTKKEQIHKHCGITMLSLYGRRSVTIQIIKGMKRKREKQNMLSSHSLNLHTKLSKLEILSSNMMILYNWIKELSK
jgi:hypothetical protein